MRNLNRILGAALTFALAAAPVSAFAGQYQNDKYGYKLDLPAIFAVPDDREAGTVTIEAANGATLTLTGASGALNENAELRSRTGKAQSSGWTLIYPSIGPGYIIYAGEKSDQNFYEKAITSCNGNRSVTLRVDYPDSAAGAILSGLDRTATSLQSTSC